MKKLDWSDWLLAALWLVFVVVLAMFARYFLMGLDHSNLNCLCN